MSKSPEQFSESNLERPKPESHPEIFPKAESKETPELRQTPELEQEKPEGLKQKLEEIKREIDKAGSEKPLSKPEEENTASKAEKIKEYQDRYLPEHLRGKRGIISELATNFWTRTVKFETAGKENLPEKGPFLTICNHFGGGDAEALLKTFKKNDLHLAVGKENWWDSSPATRRFLKIARMIPVEESLSHLSEEEKEEALKRQGDNGKAVFRKIIDREKRGGTATNIEFTRQAVAALLRGDALGIFPEGLWLRPEGGQFGLREKAEMKQGYAGMELLIRQYKKLTGEDLPIVPTAFREDRVTGKKELIIGERLSLKENNTKLSDTDWCMAHVANMLPEEQRGYYKDMVKDKDKSKVKLVGYSLDELYNKLPDVLRKKKKEVK